MCSAEAKFVICDRKCLCKIGPAISEEPKSFSGKKMEGESTQPKGLFCPYFGGAKTSGSLCKGDLVLVVAVVVAAVVDGRGCLRSLRLLVGSVRCGCAFIFCDGDW